MRIASPEGAGAAPAVWPPPDFSPPPQPTRLAPTTANTKADARQVRGEVSFMGPRFRGGIIGCTRLPGQPIGGSGGRSIEKAVNDVREPAICAKSQTWRIPRSVCRTEPLVSWAQVEYLRHQMPTGLRPRSDEADRASQ